MFIRVSCERELTDDLQTELITEVWADNEPNGARYTVRWTNFLLGSGAPDDPSLELLQDDRPWPSAEAGDYSDIYDGLPF